MVFFWGRTIGVSIKFACIYNRTLQRWNFLHITYIWKVIKGCFLESSTGSNGTRSIDLYPVWIMCFKRCCAMFVYCYVLAVWCVFHFGTRRVKVLKEVHITCGHTEVPQDRGSSHKQFRRDLFLKKIMENDNRTQGAANRMLRRTKALNI